MAKNKIRMPSSEGGLVRYYDEEYGSKIVLSPRQVVIISIIIAILAVGLRLF